jgi:hypothetical protein
MGIVESDKEVRRATDGTKQERMKEWMDGDRE